MYGLFGFLCCEMFAVSLTCLSLQIIRHFEHQRCCCLFLSWKIASLSLSLSQLWCLIVAVVIGMKPTASCMLDRNSTTELELKPTPGLSYHLVWALEFMVFTNKNTLETYTPFFSFSSMCPTRSTSSWSPSKPTIVLLAWRTSWKSWPPPTGPLRSGQHTALRWQPNGVLIRRHVL